MILSFKTEINGKLTGFREKILKYLGQNAIDAYVELETDHFLALVKSQEIESATPKKLTIRDDPHNRWKAGRKIHFATGVRTKNYECFAEGECKDVKSIVFEVGIVPVLQVYIDGEKLNSEEWKQLSLDDGFDELGDFNKFHWDWKKMPRCGSITKKIIYF